MGYVTRTQNAQRHAEGGAFVIAGVGTEKAPPVFQHGAELQGDPRVPAQHQCLSTGTRIGPSLLVRAWLPNQGLGAADQSL